ncbi:hypothetical protein L0Z72_00300 [candidate division KSB1 bacterium]|nr:hypothetical protein [candidate division KSB1 bacterium]
MKRLWLLVCIILLFAACFSFYPSSQEKNEIKPPAKITYLVPHTSPICQGQTNTCWDFATLSLLESELLRTTGQVIRFSPMWVVYYTYLEKTKNYLKHDGNARLAGGGLTEDVFLVARKYGLVRYEDYPGRATDAQEYNHRDMDLLIKNSVEQQRQEGHSPEAIIQNVQKILEDNLGLPPSRIMLDGREVTPQEFVQNILKIDLDDYIQITSILSIPFYQFGELKIPDNWQHYDRYFNVPLDVFVNLIPHSVKNGYSLVIDMDLTENGYQMERSIATLTPRWLAPDSLTQEVREALFTQNLTTDDHLQHLVGVSNKAAAEPMHWFYIKDTLLSSHRSSTKGFIYMREDYLKMKVLSYLVNKTALKGFIEDSVLSQVL